MPIENDSAPPSHAVEADRDAIDDIPAAAAAAPDMAPESGHGAGPDAAADDATAGGDMVEDDPADLDPAGVDPAEGASVEQYDEEDPLVVEGDIAGDYLERLLDILDVDGDIDLDVEGSRAVVAVGGGDLSHLVGPRGQTLDALQELTRLAVTARTGTRSRLMLDIDGYRAAQRTSLTEIARAAVNEVLGSGSEQRLRPMNPFERKVVHDVVATIGGVMSESTGEEPNRRVVIRPAR